MRSTFCHKIHGGQKHTWFSIALRILIYDRKENTSAFASFNYAVENHARKSFKIESEFCDGKEEERKEKPNEKEKLLRLPMAKRNGANYI